MTKDFKEWLVQSEYDFQVAELMFSGGRYSYAVFMAHLAIEKSLKGIFQKKFNDFPPRTHSLIYFVNKLQITAPEEIGKFLVRLDQVSVATRYPEDLAKLQSIYTQDTTRQILLETKGALTWAKAMY